MSLDYILAIDQGTTSSKAVLVTTSGEIAAEASVRVPLSFPRPGWVECDGRDLWRTVQEAVASCFRQAGGPRVAAIALTNQRESVLAWDRRTGEPLGPCISWQCRRTADACADLRAAGHDGLLRERTGLGIDPLFSGTKARWLLDRIDGGPRRAADGALAIGTVDTWILWNLTGGEVFATDLTNASRTQLLDLERRGWDDELLGLFGVPRSALAEVRASSARFGTTHASGPVPAGVTIAALAGDSHAALFGHGAPGPGSVKATYGTGTSVMAPTSSPIRVDGLSTTIAWAIEGDAARNPGSVVYAVEGNITATGAALEWTASLLGMAGREGELERLARSVDDAGGVYFVPALAGLGAPHWDPDARGLIAGLTRGSTAAHLARATFEAIAYQVRDVIDVLRASLLTKPTALYVDGGAMRSGLLAEIQAAAVGLPVVRNPSASLAALGAAYLAGITVGVWSSTAVVRDLPRTTERTEPRPEGIIERDGYAGWRQAVRRAAGRLEPHEKPVGTGS